MLRSVEGRERRKRRIRKKIHGSAERPRLSVFRSAKHIYAQVVDDMAGKTLVSVGSTSSKVGASGAKLEQAKVVGKNIAELCKSKGIQSVVFDRNGYIYHGRVRALADAAREAGLQF